MRLRSIRTLIYPYIVWSCSPCLQYHLNAAPIDNNKNNNKDNPYVVLGVSRDATTADIKRAYRRKALHTHPDKKDQETSFDQATEEFRTVVDAFEVLSDPQSRQHYDRTGRVPKNNNGSTSTSSSHRQQQQQQQWSWHFSRSHRRQALKDTPKVREAQLRVMHVVSLAQLETVMLDDSMNAVERSLLLCFVTPPTESIATDQWLFPYPFAGLSSQGIWWEEILQTAMVRYHRSNELTEFFGIPPGDQLSQPVIVYVRKGDPLSKFTTFSAGTSTGTTHIRRETLETWVWEQLQVQVTFVNQHHHAVELYWASETRATLKATLQPHETHVENTMLSHEYMARDARVDTFPGSPGRYKIPPNSRLGTYQILSTEPQRIVIATRSCVDTSGHCSFWSVHPKGECERNPGFMHDKCPRTCGTCTDHDEEDVDKNGTEEL